MVCKGIHAGFSVSRRGEILCSEISVIRVVITTIFSPRQNLSIWKRYRIKFRVCPKFLAVLACLNFTKSEFLAYQMMKSVVLASSETPKGLFTRKVMLATKLFLPKTLRPLVPALGGRFRVQSARR